MLKNAFKKYQETFSAIYGFHLNFELLILRMDFLSHEDCVNSLVGECFILCDTLELSFLHLEGKALANITDL